MYSSGLVKQLGAKENCGSLSDNGEFCVINVR